jgi:multidrug efflux system membrane fusion protein
MPENRSITPRRKTLWVAILVVVAIAVVGWWFFFKSSPPSAETPAAQQRSAGRGPGAARGGAETPVKVATATRSNLDIVLRALGTVTAYNTVTVRSRVDGELIRVDFQEGQRVKAGQLLAQIDPRSYEVSLAQALGQQQQNQALLANARRDLQRYQTLFKQDSIARQRLDTQEALVRQYEGTQKIDQAAVDNAKLQLSYTKITAPIDGRLGLRKVDVGNLVSSGDTAGLVVITQTEPIAVVFSLPETQLPEVLAQIRQGHTLKVYAYDRADQKMLATGVLETIDNQIDSTTGTVKLKARFDNADEMLFPNQFVNVRLLVQTREDATVIPTAAVQQGAAGPFVFLVREDNTVEVRQVKLGAIHEGKVGVNQGLVPGDRVVIEGTDRLREGAKVMILTSGEGAPSATDAPATRTTPTRGPRNPSAAKAP